MLWVSHRDSSTGKPCWIQSPPNRKQWLEKAIMFAFLWTSQPTFRNAWWSFVSFSGKFVKYGHISICSRGAQPISFPTSSPFPGGGGGGSICFKRLIDLYPTFLPSGTQSSLEHYSPLLHSLPTATLWNRLGWKIVMGPWSPRRWVSPRIPVQHSINYAIFRMARIDIDQMWPSNKLFFPGPFPVA